MQLDADTVTLENVSFETTCFGRDNATFASLEVERKLRGVAELQRQVARGRRAPAALDPEQIGALLFQGARLLTASAGGELLGYAVVTRGRLPAVHELLVSPRAGTLPVGPALLERADAR